MEIILREDIDQLGLAGEIVKVKPGYARNYLLPGGFAYVATEANTKRVEHEAAAIAERREKARSAAEATAASLADIHLTFGVKVGEEDKLYGSITTGDIQRALAERGLEVDKRRIGLEEPIRELGEFEVPIRLHTDVKPTIKLSVERE